MAERRPSWQTLKDGGAGTEECSRALRHKNTVVTERYYARLRPERAFKTIGELFG